jgi:hypothetical protein
MLMLKRRKTRRICTRGSLMRSSSDGGKETHDLASYAVVWSVLLLVALAAAFRPALRALKLDPAAILHHE